MMFMPRPLLVTQDAGLEEDVLRLAAVTGCELERAEHPGKQWQSASAVFLDAESAAVVAASGLRRRPSVFVLCRTPTPELWKAAFEIGAERAIQLPAEETDLVDLLGDATSASTTGSGRVIGVVGGCGGAGATVLASAVALIAAASGERCLLLDCDPRGGGVDLAVGIESDTRLRWSGLTVSGGRVASAALHDVLPERAIGAGKLTVLACDRDGPSSGLTPHAVRAVVDSARRSGETVVCDLPRSLPESAATAARLADRVVMVVPAEVRACAAAGLLVTELEDVSAGPLSVVVRGPAPGGLTPEDVRRALGVEILTVLRRQPRLPAVLDRTGLWPGIRGPIARAAKAVLASMHPTEPPVGAR